MYDLNDAIFGKISLLNIWFFITEKCNLSCDYCFFRRRAKERTISIAQISHLLKKLPPNRRYDFVISGGEPLLCWHLVKKTIELMRKIHPNSEITLQTNMFFLSENKACFLQKKDVVIEPGLDGGFISNFRHRIGFTESSFRKCVDKLSLIVKNRLRMNPTMTVHPQEVELMFTNFKKLISLGLNSIEVHPAFLADWRKTETGEFIRQYKRILEYEKSLGKNLVSKEYSFYIKNFSLDLVIQPDGFVLPNWTYLAFPYKLRRNFFIMKLSGDGIMVSRDKLRSYLRESKIIFRKRITYRDFSNYNASLILNFTHDKALKERFLVYKYLCNNIQALDQLFIKRSSL